jgi:hypothetical protein
MSNVAKSELPKNEGPKIEANPKKDEAKSAKWFFIIRWFNNY